MEGVEALGKVDFTVTGKDAGDLSAMVTVSGVLLVLGSVGVNGVVGVVGVEPADVCVFGIMTLKITCFEPVGDVSKGRWPVFAAAVIIVCRKWETFVCNPGPR